MVSWMGLFAKETYIFKEPTNRSHPIGNRSQLDSRITIECCTWMLHLHTDSESIEYSHVSHVRTICIARNVNAGTDGYASCRQSHYYWMLSVTAAFPLRIHWKFACVILTYNVWLLSTFVDSCITEDVLSLLNDRSLLQMRVSVIGLFCKRHLYFEGAY